MILGDNFKENASSIQSAILWSHLFFLNIDNYSPFSDIRKILILNAADNLLLCMRTLTEEDSCIFP